LKTTTEKKEAGMSERTLAEAFHPGEFLRDELDERGWTQAEFAEIINRPYQLVNEIIAGKRSITPETAKELGAALGTSAEFWMNLDSTYQLWKSAPVSPRVAHQANMRSKYAVREMIRRAWIQPSEDPQVLESRLLRYFEVPSLDIQPKLAFAAKRSGVAEELSPIECAWLYRVKHIAETLPAPQYSKKSLTSALTQLADLREVPEEIGQVPPLLAKCGVRLVIVEPLPSSKIDGVCLWLDSSPVIGLSLRFDRIDNFWFVLRHEIEHVLNEHGKDSPIVDSELDVVPMEPENESAEEKVANLAAAEFCVPQQELYDFIARVGPLFSRKRVLAFARNLRLHPGLVVGQLQRQLHRYDLFRPMLVPIRVIITPVAMTDGYGYVYPVQD
jgi:HTH-type transcriptional regulator / antitoxin HigA